MAARHAPIRSALRIVETLRAAGYEAYLAGGCVRDLLLGREPADYDVATSATPDMVLRCFRGPLPWARISASCWWRPRAIEGRTGYVVTEVATFRSDGVYSDGRHPDAVRYTRSAEEDVQRRDFTINGLLLDPLRGGGPLDELFGRTDRCRAPRCSIMSAAWRISMPASSARSASPARRFEEDHLAHAARGAVCGAIRICDRSRDACGDARTGSAHPRRQPRARARRADQRC